jgi:hypothetical protein
MAVVNTAAAHNSRKQTPEATCAPVHIILAIILIEDGLQNLFNIVTELSHPYTRPHILTLHLHLFVISCFFFFVHIKSRLFILLFWT